MKEFLADSNYHQFYVADRNLEPDAPTEWTDEDIKKHHLTKEYISALCPVADIDAKIFSCGPNEALPGFPDAMDFEVTTEIRIPSGKVGIYGWPWELEDEYDLGTTECEILFRGYATEKKDSEEDYYLVQVKPKGAKLSVLEEAG